MHFLPRITSAILLALSTLLPLGTSTAATTPGGGEPETLGAAMALWNQGIDHPKLYEFYRKDLLRVKFGNDHRVRMREGELVDLGDSRALDDPQTAVVLDQLNAAGTQIVRTWRVNEATIDGWCLGKVHTIDGTPIPDLNNCYLLQLPPNLESGPAARMLDALATVDYVEFLPKRVHGAAVDGNGVPDFADRSNPLPTGIFQRHQDYLGPAPAGVDADFARPSPHGRGAGVDVVAIEFDTAFNHIDLWATREIYRTPANAYPSDEEDIADNREHGTAVMGIMAAADDGIGVTGIAPDASHGFSSIVRPIGNTYDPDDPSDFTFLVAEAVADSINATRYGDVFNMSIGVPGPFSIDPDKDFGGVGIEWLRSVYDIVKLAVNTGRIITVAAGNGSQNLDDPVYSITANPGWAPGTGPFMPEHRSGSITVGAGQPPEWDDPRSRIEFSNYGSRVDLQGWGKCVVTTGYNDAVTDTTADPCFELMTTNRNFFYTSDFGGTSAAAPIVAGCCAVMQSMLTEINRSPSSPAEILAILQSTATSQVGSDQIGGQPNLRAALESLLDDASEVPVPVSSPPFGSYRGTSALFVSFDDSDGGPNNRIHYTLDGSEPTTGSPKWITGQSTILLRDTRTLTALRFRTDPATGIVRSSSLMKGTYDISDKMSAPIFLNADTGEEIANGASLSSPFRLRITTPAMQEFPGLVNHRIRWRFVSETETRPYLGPITFDNEAAFVLAYTEPENARVTASDLSDVYFSAIRYTGTSVGGQPQLLPPQIIPDDTAPLLPSFPIRILTNVPGGVIRYTTDGSEPNATSPMYAEPFGLSASAIVKAHVNRAGYPPSGTTTRNYNVLGSAPVPEFFPSGGILGVSDLVTLSTPVPGARIHYTLDGRDPDTSSPVYPGPFAPGIGTHVIKARSFLSGLSLSGTATASYTVYSPDPDVLSPVFWPPSGNFNETLQVTLACDTEGATIHCTIDDFADSPTESDPAYSPGTPILLTHDIAQGGLKFLKARAFKPGFPPSPLITANYTVFPVNNTIVDLTIEPGARTFNNETTFVLRSNTPSVAMKYTLDGSTPSPETPPSNPATMIAGRASGSSGPTESFPVTINASAEVRFLGTRLGYGETQVGSAYFQFLCADPSITPEPGIHHGSVTFALDSATEQAVLHYTTDGSTPTTGSPIYENPVTLGEGEHFVQVIAVKSGYTSSTVNSAVFEVTPPLTAPLLTSSPADKRVPLDGAITLIAGATGYPEPVFTWERDGFTLPDTGPVLGLLNITNADFGTYTVAATNSEGESSEASFTLSESVVHEVATLNDGGPGSLRQAVLDAAEGDIIRFDLPDLPDTVIPLTTGTPLLIEKCLTIDGSDRVNPIAISGDADDSGTITGADVRIFTVTTGGDLTLDSLILRHGERAIINSAAVTIENCRFEDNSTEANPFSRTGPADPHSGADGGAIFNHPTGFLIVHGSIFFHNEAGDNGGAIYNRGSLVASECQFENNEAGDSGGGIRSESGSTTRISGCGFTGNNVDGWGGAIAGIGTTIIEDSTFSQNDANSDGGALQFASSGSPQVSRCTFFLNTAGDDGGAIASFRPLTLSDSTFDQNTCADDGAGLYNEGNLTMSRCTGTGNFEGGSGGILRHSSGTSNINNSTFDTITFISGGNLTMTNVTIANETGGNGIRLVAGDLHLKNCIVSPFNGTNFTTSISMDDSGNETLTVSGKNLVSVNTSVEDEFSAGSLVGTAISPVDPLLSPLGDHGGPTQTRMPLPGSPAIDPYPGFIGSSLVSDQRGFSRYTGLFVDCGAVEHQPGLIVTNALDNGPGSLREAALGVGNGGAITFDGPLSGQTIDLESPLQINRSMNLDGSNLNPALTLDGGGITRLIEIAAGANVELDTFLLQNGTVGQGESGAAIHSQADTLSILNSTIANNSAGNGGGLFVNAGQALLINSTLSGNQATRGGAIALDNGADLSLWSCTVAGNSATSTGGAIHAYQDLPASSVGLRNSIVAANTAPSEPEFSYWLRHAPPSGVNLIGDNENATSVYPADGIRVGGDRFPIVDPLLLTLANYGGPTPTMDLLLGSPAIDAALPDPEVALDQRGLTRPIDGDNNGSIAPDIGAVERRPRTLANLFPSTDPGGDGDANNNGISDYLEYANGFDPTAPGLPNLTPTFDIANRTFSHTVRNGVDDVYYAYEYSSTLGPGPWQPLPLQNYQLTFDYTPETPVIEIDGEDFLDYFDHIFLRIRFRTTP